MLSVLISLPLTLQGLVRSRAALHLEMLALRHQLLVLDRPRPRRVRLATALRVCRHEVVATFRKAVILHCAIVGLDGRERVVHRAMGSVMADNSRP
jgi:hypothetical protein